MTETTKVKLKHPISDGKVEWDELEFPTRFKLKHMRAFPKGFMDASQNYAEAMAEEATKAAAENREPVDLPVPEGLNLTLMDLSPIVAKLTGVSEEAIDELDQDDWETVSTATMDFFASLQQGTGEPSSGE